MYIPVHACVFRYGDVPNDFGMDDLNCTGKELNIRKCPHHKCDDCGSKEGAGVVCAGNKTY